MAPAALEATLAAALVAALAAAPALLSSGCGTGRADIAGIWVSEASTGGAPLLCDCGTNANVGSTALITASSALGLRL